MEPFQNPDFIPLEDLMLKVKTGGIADYVPALDEKWVEERYFLHYEVPNIYSNNGCEIMGAKEHWIEIMSYMIDDLKWVLSLPFYRFWSNIVFNTSILDALVSFLQDAPPFYALESFPNDSEMRSILETLRHYVLLVFARLVTNKESPTEHMTIPFLGRLLYDNFIFTVPIIYDLCQLYGRENEKAVTRILDSLFKIQPLYNDDVERSVPYLVKALSNVETRFQDRPIYLSGEAVPLSNGQNDGVKITLFALEDMILYVLDISSTISTFLKNYPASVKKYHNENFINKIVSIYENTIPEMYKKLNELAYNEENLTKFIELRHRLDVTRIELLHLYRTIVHEPMEKIHQKLDILTVEEIKEQVDDYLNFLSNAISEKEFITDYHQFYPVGSDLEELSKICPELDTIKRNYILQAVYAAIGDSQISAVVSSSDKNEVVAGPSSVQSNQPSTSSENVIPENVIQEPVRRSSVEVASLVSEVKDILGHLGEGFIQMCLKHYNYNTAAVINSILEHTLPPNLSKLDVSLPYIPPDPEEASIAVDNDIGVERLNVFDNDEFDIMTRDVIDMSRVHKGKRKDKYKNINELLNDKSEVRKVSDIYSKYSLVMDDYDDEYDDTYDSHDVRGTAQDDVPDSRSFTTPRVLLAKEKHSTESEDEKDSDSDGENNSNELDGRDCFVQNPADLRAKAENRRQALRGNKPTNDVAGKPKGQGQDKDVTINRDKKNTHKATRANHNRRAGAQWKQRQGMIPS
ncbi:hypothetical protein KPH14_003608 [Odynerus spinipes]|uniref:CUE domain-containing protein n=1 Tax=Odynerus spinipes TaxID=1348599 RepID=A0AAD9RD17_9HYME|nr:hypothetical protein KPH14_003608 [Odynerus spinipes]